MPTKPPAKKSELPSTVARSDKRARETFDQTRRSAEQTYDDPGAAARVAYSALKHGYEKVGDHWEPKERKGPSDAQAARSGRRARRGGETAGGVDANASKAHLLELARRLDVPGRSRMSKAELVEALQKANARETARARDDR